MTQQFKEQTQSNVPNTVNSKTMRVLLQAHYLWLITDGKDGKRADLSGQVLSGMNLVAANLEKAVLEGTVLEGADLSRSNLRGANMQGAGLQHANLQGADLRDANLRGAYLRDTNLQGAYLRDTNLQGAYLREANLQGAYLRDTNMRSAYLREANLQGAYLWRTDLRGADVQTVRLQAAQLESVIGYAFYDTPGNIKRLIEGYDQQISALQDRLRSVESAMHAKGELSNEQYEEVRKLQDKLWMLNEAKKQREESLAQRQEEEAELIRQTKLLEQRTGRAQRLLISALESSRQQIQVGRWSALMSGAAAVALLVLDASVMLIPLAAAWHGTLTPDTPMYTLLSTLGAWSTVFYIFPVVILLAIAVFLLYHQRKLLTEVRRFAAMKHRVEMLSGLLDASQYAAAGLEDPVKASEYVQETFSRIRDNLLIDIEDMVVPNPQPPAEPKTEQADDDYDIKSADDKQTEQADWV